MTSSSSSNFVFQPGDKREEVALEQVADILGRDRLKKFDTLNNDDLLVRTTENVI